MQHVLTCCVVLVFAPLALASPPSSRNLSSYTDKYGQHPATAELSGPATITCKAAHSDFANAEPAPACAVTAPGYSGVLAAGESAQSTGAGVIVLTCNGRGHFVTCSASIKQ